MDGSIDRKINEKMKGHKNELTYSETMLFQ